MLQASGKCTSVHKVCNTRDWTGQLDIPQCISPQPAMAAPSAESVLFKVQNVQVSTLEDLDHAPGLSIQIWPTRSWAPAIIQTLKSAKLARLIITVIIYSADVCCSQRRRMNGDWSH